LIAQSFLYEEGLQKGLALENIRDRWRQTVATGSWDAAVMALGQHYGIPTPGLDITSSLEVALWFATNKFTKIAPDQARYVPLSTDDWLTDSADWPTLYILRPVTRSLTPSIQSVHLLEAKRRYRQCDVGELLDWIVDMSTSGLRGTGKVRGSANPYGDPTPLARRHRDDQGDRRGGEAARPRRAADDPSLAPTR
jgi:hypothetical protein